MERPSFCDARIFSPRLLDWQDDYLFGPNGAGNENVSGFFYDDEFDASGPSEYEAHVNQDIGYSAAQLQSTSDAYWQYMSVVYAAVLARGKFVWQQMWRVRLPARPRAPA